MRRTRWLTRGTVAAGLALAMTACAQFAATPPPAPAPAAPALVLDDQLVSRIQRGVTKMDQVRGMIDAKPIINFQAGHEVWIYQGVAQPGATDLRTLTVQYDEHGVVRNVGKVDLPK
jgi:hypothetical protein